MALRQPHVRREDNPPTEPGTIGSVTGAGTYGSAGAQPGGPTVTPTQVSPTQLHNSLLNKRIGGRPRPATQTPPETSEWPIPPGGGAANPLSPSPGALNLPGLPGPGYVYSGGYTPPLVTPSTTSSHTQLAPELAAERNDEGGIWGTINDAADKWNNMVDTAITGAVDFVTPNVGVIERPVHGAVDNVINTLNTAGAIGNQIITNPIQSAQAVQHAATETGRFVYNNPGRTWDIAFESGRDYVTNPWNIAIDGGLLAASLYTGGGAGAGLVARMAARTGTVLNRTRVGRQVVRGVGSAQRIRRATGALEAAEGASTMYRPGRVMNAVDTALELQPRASSAVRTRLGLNEFGATSRARTALGNKIGTGNEGWRAAVGDFVRDSSYRPGSVSRATGAAVGAPLSESAAANRLATNAWRVGRVRELRAQHQFFEESHAFWSDPVGYAAEKGQNFAEEHPEVATQVGQAVMQNPRFQQEVGRAVGQGLDAVADAQQQGLSRLTEGIEDFKSQIPDGDEEEKEEKKKPKQKRQPEERRRLAQVGYTSPTLSRASEDRRRPRKLRPMDPEEEVESDFFVTPSRRGSFYESAAATYGGR